MRLRRPPPELWQLLRAAVWARDGGRCQGPYCTDAPPISLEAAHIDHIRPRTNGGSHHPDNLRVLCRRCQSTLSPTCDRCEPPRDA